MGKGGNTVFRPDLEVTLGVVDVLFTAAGGVQKDLVEGTGREDMGQSLDGVAGGDDFREPKALENRAKTFEAGEGYVVGNERDRFRIEKIEDRQRLATRSRGCIQDRLPRLWLHGQYWQEGRGIEGV
ncbi:MAG: hypothetical protein UX35_C0020G0001 [Microgenomates group bacterium GW2011_GWA1_46_15]|uniref:Uncharacterized protein n=1 Tax=Candidatus Amesbacteria bacterium GW2011_GWC1_47_15 TaxID=1618364 RepID=A0A0G1S058_9BACT|nr:MAG: hypothetical protein UX35_C0020G0001 [Microgenomates group bacterium GW2011_GWA1_46_15]KKU62721.1 MAG: hypothetical protein UX86_C0044G0010 [Candidatus Amesbacteria bacterium GW2011_GWC1_47_15]